MANPPWKFNLGGPSDEELNRVVQAHEAQHRGEVRRQVGDPKIYESRLTKRGWTDDSHARWIWDKKTKSKRPVANRRHAASAAVNEGSIAIITTAHPPTNITLPLLYTVDKRKAIDQHRKDQRYELLPTLTDEDGEEVAGIEVLTDDQAYAGWRAGAAKEQDAQADAEEQEEADNMAIQKLAREAGVSDRDLWLVIQNKQFRWTTRQLAAQEGVSHTAIIKRVGRVIRKMKGSPGGEVLLKRMGWL